MKIPLRTPAVGVAALMLILLVGARPTVGAGMAHAGHPGSLDRGFGHNGLVIQGFGAEQGYGGASEAAPMPDGGFVVKTVTPAIGRYRADGSLDTGFGDDGYALRGGSPRTISTTADGRVYVLGWDETEEIPTLRRLLSDGTPDRSFASDGVLSLESSLPEVERALALPGGGVLLVGAEREEKEESGERVYRRVYAERLREDGSPDPAYGSGGIATVPVPPHTLEGALVYTLDGDRLMFALQGNGSAPLMLVRLEANGQIDPTLDASTVEPEARVDNMVGLVSEADGRIVICGRWGRLLRLLPDGRPDPSFGEGGSLRLDLPGETPFIGIVARPGGGVFLGGNTRSPREAGDLVLAALTGDTGALDPTVGAGSGYAVFDTGNPDEGAALTTLADGDLLLAGQSDQERDSIVAARFTTAGSLDSAFGSGGLLVTRPLRLSADEATAVVPGPGGTIVAAGRAARRAVVVRYRPNGHLDRRYGEGGFVSAAQLAFESGGSRVTDLLRRPGGGVLVAVTSRDRARVVGLKPGGAVDDGIGRGGELDTADFRSVTDLAGSDDGSILVSGYAAKGCRPLVERLRPDGDRDHRFAATPLPIENFGSCSRGVLVAARPGGGAYAVPEGGRTPIALRSEGSVDPGFELSDFELGYLPRRVEAIATDRRGGLLLGGTLAHRLAVARITKHGHLDRRFGRRGEALREVGREAQARALLVEATGSIVAAGVSHTCVEQPCSGSTAILARFTASGDPDRGFGRAGVWKAARGGGSLAALASVSHAVVAAGLFTRVRDEELLLAKVRR
jgi:uncharacterized delta-60 repeat protein